MRTRLIIGVAMLLLLLAGAAVWSLMSPAAPVAHIYVIDGKKQPVAGATIRPDGLRPKGGGGHYFWTEEYPREGLKWEETRTDASGRAELRYPFFVDEKLETGEVSFAVDHPDFCADRPFRAVDSRPPLNASIQTQLKYYFARITRKVATRPDPVVLQRGGVAQVSAYIGDTNNIITDVHGEISKMWPAGTNFWRHDARGLVSRKVTPGKTMLRLVHFPTNGAAMFSDFVSFHAKSEQTNTFHLELKPGVHVIGQFSDDVPRPVRNGRVCIRVFPLGNKDGSAPAWGDWREVDADGRFTFASVPPGNMEIMGTCDGFVSQNGTSATAATTMRLPQSVTLEPNAKEQSVTLVMEAAASCEFAVTDDQGRPLANATVNFWPNILWGGTGSTIFGYMWSTEKLLRGEEKHATRDRLKNLFTATTDARGLATVSNLPPGSMGYAVGHTNFEMRVTGKGTSASRSAIITLGSGAVGSVNVTLQPKGSEAITH